jgi:hypothetical protein
MKRALALHVSPKAQGNGGPRKEHNKQYDDYTACLESLTTAWRSPAWALVVPDGVSVVNPADNADSAYMKAWDEGAQAYADVMALRDGDHKKAALVQTL